MNGLKIIYGILKLGFHITHHALYNTILPFLTVIITVHGNSHILLTYLSFLISTMQISRAHTGFLEILL